MVSVWLLLIADTFPFPPPRLNTFYSELKPTRLGQWQMTIPNKDEQKDFSLDPHLIL